MDLAALIRSFSTASGYAITRTARGRMARGRMEPGAITTVTCTASVSPIGANDLEKLPEGRQFNDAKVVITTTQLMIGGQGEDYEADVIAIGPQSYEVKNLDVWFDPSSGATAYRAIVAI